MNRQNEPSTAALLTAAERAGLEVRINAAGLQVRGPAAARAQFLPALQAHKPALTRLMRAETPGSISHTPARPWRCARCWCYFAEAELHVVAEPLGRGFRCAACRRRERG